MKRAHYPALDVGVEEFTFCIVKPSRKFDKFYELQMTPNCPNYTAMSEGLPAFQIDTTLSKWLYADQMTPCCPNDSTLSKWQCADPPVSGQGWFRLFDVPDSAEFELTPSRFIQRYLGPGQHSSYFSSFHFFLSFCTTELVLSILWISG